MKADKELIEQIIQTVIEHTEVEDGGGARGSDMIPYIDDYGQCVKDIEALLKDDDEILDEITDQQIDEMKEAKADLKRKYKE